MKRLAEPSANGLLLLFIFAAYYAAGKCGLHFAFLHVSATPVWPPTGISLAAYLIFGRRMWPAIFAGAFFVNWTTAGNIWTSFSIAGGNTLEGVIGATLINRWGNGLAVFEQPGTIGRYVFFAGIVSPIVAATIGTATLYADHLLKDGTALSVWFTWWLGDAGGNIVVAPLLILLKRSWPFQIHRNQWLEGFFLMSGFIAMGCIVFGGLLPHTYQNLPLAFLFLPFLTWMAFRFGMLPVALLNILLAAVAIPGTLHGLGPFARSSANESLLLLQAFVIVTTATSLTLAAVIEQRQKAIEAVRDLNQILETKVTSRTTELLSANQELEAFSYSISHDLRAPLRAIGGFAEILTQEPTSTLSNEGKRLLRVIRQNTRYMSQLVDDLLAFSKISRQDIAQQIIDMTSLASSIGSELIAATPERMILLDVHPLPTALGDPLLIRQVWVNLISNAIKFTRRTSAPSVTVGAQTNASETVYFVRDNGVGFDPQYAQRLFGVFQRLHGSDDFEGTGVGLAIVQRIIHKHGGRVSAESKLGEGATFYFSLPHTRS